MLAAAWLPLALASSSEPDAPLTLGDRMEAAALERRRHGETHRVVILTMLADDYAPLHDQMMCSLKRLNLSSHVVIATDKRSTCDNLLPEWRAQCFELDPVMLTKEASYQGLEARESRDWDEFQLRAGFDTEPSASGNRTELAVPYDYGSAGFRRIAQMKPLLTRVGNLRGLDVLFTDGDIVFVSDPIHDLYSHRFDLVVQDDAVGGWTSSCKKKGDHNVNSGFYLLRAGDGSKALVKKWLASIYNNPKLGAGDQIHLNAVLHASCYKQRVSKKAGFSWKVLSRAGYPNGKMYYTSPHTDGGYRLTKEHRIVHFNWLRGIPKKLSTMGKEGLKFAGTHTCREPEALLALEKRHETRAEAESARTETRAEVESARTGMLPCDSPPYVLDELHYAREGTGSSIWPHSTSIIFADAIGASWIDDPETGREASRTQGNVIWIDDPEGEGEASTARGNVKHPEQGASALTPEAMPPKIWNSHDKTDYAPFLGFRHDPQCDFASLKVRIAAGELQVVDATTSMYGDQISHSWSDLKRTDTTLPKNLVHLCSAIARGSAPPSTDPLLKLAGANRSNTVFRFHNYGDHRFTGATDCLYNPHFRSRYHAARASRLLHFSTAAGAERPKDELWLSVHYRSGDVEHSKEYVRQGRGDLAALAYYVRAAVRYLKTDPARLHGRTAGLRPVVHFFSEGEAHAFKRFTDVLPDAVLHLGNKRGDTTKHDIDLMTQSHVLIGGFSTFFQMAAHLCDACVVLSADVAKDASRMDTYIGGRWPRGNEFVKLHHGSAGEEPFDGNLFGRALAKVLAASAEKKALPCGPYSERAACAKEHARKPAQKGGAPEPAEEDAGEDALVAKPDHKAQPSPSPSEEEDAEEAVAEEAVAEEVDPESAAAEVDTESAAEEVAPASEDEDALPPCGAHAARAACASPPLPPAAPPPPSLSPWSPPIGDHDESIGSIDIGKIGGSTFGEFNEDEGLTKGERFELSHGDDQTDPTATTGTARKIRSPLWGAD